MRRNRKILAAIVVLVFAVVAFAINLNRSSAGDHPTPRLAGSAVGSATGAQPGVVVSVPPTAPVGDDASGTLPAITPAVPGKAQVVSHGPADSGAVALTFDDGYCDLCVAGLVAGVERTGVPVTFCPNGVYGPASWEKYATRIKTLIGKGEVTICNHTWDHKDLTKMDAGRIRTELTRNEDWIEKTFGVSSRPFFRPPYGYHNRIVDAIAAQLGYTQVLIWSGTLGDSVVQTPDFVLNQMRMYARPGSIILGHGNHPATASVFDQLAAVGPQMGLRMVTVAELLARPQSTP
ncbi:MAG: polysaccharide deacetylase family protein [Actinomycetota bacterium]|nr:polysaccharide deacetylase family protein [Actinomycetota bacterium]